MPTLDMELGGGPWKRKRRANDEVFNRENGASIAPNSPFFDESDAWEEREWTPWIVPMFVAANMALFVVVMFVNNCPDNFNLYGSCVLKFLNRFSFQPLKQNPLLGPSSSTLEKLGALVWDKVVHQHEGWRLFTGIWLHAGVIHLLPNMLILVFIGIRLEQQFGFVLTFCSADRLDIPSFWLWRQHSVISFIRNSISVGASGALFGLLGAMLSELIINWTMYSKKAAALLILVFIIVINLAIGILPNVDNFAHIGGFITGFLLGFILLRRPQFGRVEGYKCKYTACQYFFCVFSLLLLIAGFVFGLKMLFQGIE
ncbi:hypothetical protein HPP92_022030 [Vanilla planifolia]|uniref:RHOMBOID-like protein n=1 Tax=Vanilla planifolia TaxID=51239 RepID=A0A835UER1_VANPL|nr:hypothetical protein HPP92_022030 [Vanilla planifolia]